MASAFENRLRRTIEMAGTDGQAGPVPVMATPSESGVVDMGFGVSSHQMPPGFSRPAALPNVTAYRHGDRFYCSHGPEDLIDTSLYAVTYYVDSDGGNDANTGLSWAQRKQSIQSARLAALAGGVPARVLINGAAAMPYHKGLTFQTGSTSTIVSAVPMLFEAIDGRVKTGAFDNAVWTLAGTYRYTATITGPVRVLNTTVLDADGLYAEYKWVASVELCEATEGSWFASGTTVSVHPHNHAVPNIFTARVMRTARGLEWGNTNNLMLRGIDFEGGLNGPLRVNLGLNTSIIVVDDCSMRYSSYGATELGINGKIDGVQIDDCGLFAAFNSSADRNGKDGFNFHAGSNGFVPSALLVNCKGRYNGQNPSTSNNGFTIHEAVKAVTIGCEWVGNYGANVGHISNGSQHWAVGDVAGMSRGDVAFGGTQISTGFGVVSSTGVEMWLDSCRDVGCEVGIGNGGTSVIHIRNHKGSGARTGTVVPY